MQTWGVAKDISCPLRTESLIFSGGHQDSIEHSAKESPQENATSLAQFDTSVMWSTDCYHDITGKCETGVPSLRDVVDLMIANQISLDVRSQTGTTLLDCAIIAGNYDHVAFLLDAGACVEGPPGTFNSPIFMAMRSPTATKTAICELLLARGARASELRSSHSSLQVLLDYIASAATDADRVHDYRLLEACLEPNPKYPKTFERLGDHAELDTLSGSAFRVFLRSWQGSLAECRGDYDAGLSCLKAFLRRGFDPFTRECGGFFCPDGTCTSFVALALFHAWSTTCGNAILEASRTPYRVRLVELLLSPCASRRRRQTGTSMEQNLARMLTGTNLNLQKEDLISTLLERFPDEDEDKASMLTVLLHCGRVDLHKRTKRGTRPIESLLQVKEPLRWRLAEIMLSERTSDSQSTSLDQGQAWIRCLSSYPTYFHHLCHYLDASHGGPPQYLIICSCKPRSRKMGNTLFGLSQCAIHVATTLMAKGALRETAGMSIADRLLKAITMRQQFNLPDLAIDSEVISELLRTQAVVSQNAHHFQGHSATGDRDSWQTTIGVPATTDFTFNHPASGFGLLNPMIALCNT